MSSFQYMPSLKNDLFQRFRQFGRTLTDHQTVIDLLKLLKWEFQFLDYFLQLHTDEPNMLDLNLKVQTLFEDALVDLPRLHLAERNSWILFKVQNKILLTKIEIKSRYSFPIAAYKDDFAIPKFVTEFVHSVAESLPDVVKIDDPETSEHVKDVLKEMEMLYNFSCFVLDRFVEPQPQVSQHLVNFFTHVLSVAGRTAMLSWLYLPDMAPQEISVLLFHFLRMRIKPIQPRIRKIYVDVLQSLKYTLLQSGWYQEIRIEDAVESQASFVDTILHKLMELPTNSNSTQMIALKDHLVSLQKMLNLLRAHVNSVSMKDLEFLQDIDTIIIDVGLLVYSSYNGEAEKKEVMAPGEVNTTIVLDLMGNIQHTNIVLSLNIPKAFQSNLPRIHGLGYVDFLLNNLKEFQSRHSDSLVPFTNQLQIIQIELESLQPFLKDVAEERFSDLGNIQRCVTRLIDKAYGVEYIVDACIRNEAPIWCLERWLLDIIKEITFIKDEVAGIYETKLFGGSSKAVTTHVSSNLARSQRMNEEIVGFEEVTEKLRYQLMRGTPQRDVISIVGMPGLGKTTLAYRLYYDTLVASHFHIRANCCVSQVYSRKELLLTLLHDVVGTDSNHREKPVDELANELRKALFSKRYLILVDDVWKASVWDDLIGCFQDANVGSRIILTTRNRDVADYARFQSEPLLLRMFRDDESWELLSKKVFREESCPPHLTNIGQRIAKKCGQLPLSVALVAGILAKMEKKEECWEQLAKDLGPDVHKDTRVIIEQSYQILPYHLKSCLMYFGAFLEDDVINVSKLIRLWISEGFIKSCRGKSLEDIAEGYLENLIGRNLVMRSKNSSRGKIKACQIHDLLHDFCTEKAKEENLLRRIKLKRDQSSSSSSRANVNKQLAHCISIYGADYDHIGDWRSCWPHVGSVISRIDCYSFDFSSHIFHSFKFLKVLDLEFTHLDSFPANLGLLYLRYFSARSNDLSILSSMKTCWNLETLLLNNVHKRTLPITLWERVKLRHLHISHFTVKNAEELLDNSKKLDGLKTLSTPYFSSVQEAELVLRKTPNLQELRCEVLGMPEFEKDSDCVLNFLTRIETLKVRGREPLCLFPFCISEANLKKLTVEHYYLLPRHISAIGLLQNLQVLILKTTFFWNGRWNVRDGEFPQLKVLKVHGSGFPGKWIVSDDAFPNLERLVLDTICYLKKIPSCFGEISTLKSIEVNNCEGCVCDSARVIRDTQVEDYQNSGFQLLIINERVNNNSAPINDDDDEDEHEDGYDDTILGRHC